VIKDASGPIRLTVWNEKIEEFKIIKPSDKLMLVGTFVTSYKGELSVNIGRGSSVSKR
jgi:hypothetical protein